MVAMIPASILPKPGSFRRHFEILEFTSLASSVDVLLKLCGIPNNLFIINVETSSLWTAVLCEKMPCTSEGVCARL
jgi:hypothetical protein